MKLLFTLIFAFILFQSNNGAQTTVVKPNLKENQPLDTLTPNRDKKDPSNKIFAIAEEQPFFLDIGCLKISNRKEQKKCGDEKLRTYVSRNTKYPDSLKAKGVQGTVVVSFVIEINGKINTIKIIRDPSPNGALGKLAVQLMNQMIEDKKLCKPGIIQKKAVALRYKLPVQFKAC